MNLERDMLEKLETLDFKYDVLSILHSLQFDGVYDVNDCIMDLDKLLKKLDGSEPSYSLILKNNKVSEKQLEHSLFHVAIPS